MSKFNIFFLFLILLVVDVQIQALDRVHVLLAGNTSSNLQPSISNDLILLKNLFKELESDTVQVNIQVLQDDTLNEKNICRWIQSLPEKSNDTFIFYFSGHGSGAPKKGDFLIRNHNREYSFKKVQNLTGSRSAWPFLNIFDYSYKIVKNQNVGGAPRVILEQKLESNISSHSIRHELKKKKPKLLIMITDVCNKSTKKDRPLKKTDRQPLFEQIGTIKKIANITKKEALKESLKNLFIRPKGTITITAAMPGMAAHAYEVSNLTKWFSHAIIHSKTAISWEELISYVEKKGLKKQKVFYKISICY